MRAEVLPLLLRRLSGCVLIAPLVWLVGCGGPGEPVSKPPVFSGTTNVTLLGSSTANDRLTMFNLTLTGLTLTNQDGTTASLITTPQSGEWIHGGGNAEPLLTVPVPQGIYTSATATVGGASFTCIYQASDGSRTTSTDAYGTTPTNQVTVNLASPLTVTGTAMAFGFDLQVTPSAVFPTCGLPASGFAQYSINPTFNLSAIDLSTKPVALTGLNGLTGAVASGGTSFAVTATDGPAWNVRTDSNTLFSGIANASALTAGMPVEMDVSVENDGSLLATRVAVSDTNPTNLSVELGAQLFLAASEPVLTSSYQQYEGYLIAHEEAVPYLDYSAATFQVSNQLRNLNTLPFTPVFSGATLFDGQNIAVTTHATGPFFGGQPYPAATTVTLMPQTLNGTVGSVTSAGGFTAYTLTLAAYDLMPQLNVQQGQTTPLLAPNQVVVYADTNTQIRNGGPIAVGSVIRANGLVFDDNGAAKMDAAWIADGVTP